MGPELDEQDSKLGMITKGEFQRHLSPLQRYMHFPIKGQGWGWRRLRTTEMADRYKVWSSSLCKEIDL